MKRSLVVAAAAFLIAGPIALAQPNQTPPAETPPVATPTTPPVTQPPPTVPSEPATPATPATPPATPGQTPATPATPATPSPNATQPNANPQGCRTRKEAGEPCACRSDPSRIGVSTASENGQNICVRPD
jgi:hypothetical protein